jgi:hypothetical protein
MTTAVSQLITDAFRENNLIEVGSTPTADEQAEALDLLNQFLAGIFGYELGENLADWQVPGALRTATVAANYPQLPYPMDLDANIMSLPIANDLDSNIYPYPPKNSRIVYGSDSEANTNTVWYPERPDNGSRMEVVCTAAASQVLTLDGNGRAIQSALTLTLTPPFDTVHHMYDATQANWVSMGASTLDGNSPLPPHFDSLLVTAVGYRLCPRHGVEPRTGTTNEMAQALKRLKAYYRQYQPTTYGSADFPRSLQSYIAGQWWW